jgi:hypothetical protein
MMVFDTKVNGISCKCVVTMYSPDMPMKVTGSGYGDAIAPEHEEFEFQLLDKRGYPAVWLEKYIDENVRDRLLEEFLVHRQAEYYDY